MFLGAGLAVSCAAIHEAGIALNFVHALHQQTLMLQLHNNYFRA